MTEPTDESRQPGEEQDPADWKLWPPSPRTQIILIAAAFGLVNLCLLAIWAYVMIRQFG